MAPKKQAATRKVQTRIQAKSNHGAKKRSAVSFFFFPFSMLLFGGQTYFSLSSQNVLRIFTLWLCKHVCLVRESMSCLMNKPPICKSFLRERIIFTFYTYLWA